MKKQLILVSRQKQDAVFAREVALTGGFSFLSFDTLQEVPDDVAISDPMCFLIDVSSSILIQDFLTFFFGRVGRGAEKIHPNRIHLIGDEVSHSSDALLRQDCFSHFIVRNFGDSAEAGKQYGRIAQNLCEKGASLLQNFLAKDTPVQVTRLSHSSQKPGILEKVRGILVEEVGYPIRIADTILTAVDEVIMNAIYDAPIDPAGNQRFSKMPRNIQFQLEESSIVELRMGYDALNVGFTIVDRFGSVKKLKLLKHLFSGTQGNPYEVDHEVANAGIGLATSFRSGGTLIFACQPGVRTEVTLFFKLEKSFKGFKGQFKFISIVMN